MGEQICRYCGEQIKANEVICSFCGYNSETRAMTPGFSKKEQKPKSSFPKTGNLHLVIFIIAMVMVVSLIVFFPDKANNIGSSIISYISNIREDVKQYHKGLKPDSPSSTGGLSQLASNIKESRGILDSFLNEDFSRKPAERKNDASIRLEGIVFDSTGRGSAIINGQVLYEGDSLGNARIIKISKNSIEVLVDGKNKVLEVNQGLP